MATTTLHYFDIYGRGELLRQFFAYAGTDYEQHSISFEEWPELKANNFSETGYLPVVETDGFKLVETWAILRYFGQKAGFYPSDPYEIYLLESLHDWMEDIRKSIAPFFKNQQWEELAKWMADNMAAKLAIVEKRLKDNKNGDGWFIGEKISILDFEVFQFVFDGFLREGKAEKGQALIDNFPKIKSFVARFMGSKPELKAYLDAREHRDF